MSMKWQAFIRKHISSIIWTIVIALLIFSPDAKAVLLRGFLKIGLFKAGTQNETMGPAMPLSFSNKAGNVIETASLKGKVVFINFWATWCPPCIAEMPSINALYNKLKDNPKFVFILADADNDFIKSAQFMDKHQYQLPVYSTNGMLPAAIFSGSLPTTIIIDSKGNIVKKHEGIANYDTEEMIQFLQSL